MALWRVRATVDDRPGFLAVLAASLALKSVNILAVQVHTTEAGAIDDFLVDAPDSMTSDDLVAAVEKGRGRNAWVAPTQAHGLVDPPTRALALAGRVARDPEALGEVLRQLLGGDFRSGAGTARVVWRPAAADPDRYGFVGARMCLPDPHGGAYEVVRDAPDFTPAEYARAHALVELARTVGVPETERTVLLLPDGTELTLRTAGPEDLAAVTAMHDRCSSVTRHRRYLSGPDGPPLAHVVRLLNRDRSTTLVATVADGSGERVVAMANLVGEGAQAEVALLVEDGWQGRGLGTALLRRIGALAARVGYRALVTYSDAENAAVLRTLDRIGTPSSIDRDGGVLTVTVPLERRGVPTATPGATEGPGAG